MDRYMAIVQTSRVGASQRRWVEIQLSGPRGGCLRVVARTPIICGEDAAADQRIRLAKIEAMWMCSTLNARLIERDA